MPAIRTDEHGPAKLDPLGDFLGAGLASLHDLFYRDRTVSESLEGAAAESKPEPVICKNAAVCGQRDG
jgi:hypothetical protein